MEVLAQLIQWETEVKNPLKKPFVLAIQTKDCELIGHVGLSAFNDSVEIGFGIDEKLQSRGYATECLMAICTWAFHYFRFEKIYAVAASHNLPSIKVLQRVGFQFLKQNKALYHGKKMNLSYFLMLSV